MIPLNRLLRQTYDRAYDHAREQRRSCVCASEAGLAAARDLYVDRKGFEDELTDACVRAMIWPRQPYGMCDLQLSDRRPAPDYGEQGDEEGEGMTAWAIRFFGGPPPE